MSKKNKAFAHHKAVSDYGRQTTWLNTFSKKNKDVKQITNVINGVVNHPPIMRPVMFQLIPLLPFRRPIPKIAPITA